MKRPKRVTAYVYRPAVVHEADCPCGSNPAGTTYYTSARDGKPAIALSGPYDTHEEALADVDRARDAAYKVDPKAPWYSYGTFAAKPGAIVLTAFCRNCMTYLEKWNRGRLCAPCARPAAKRRDACRVRRA